MTATISKCMRHHARDWSIVAIGAAIILMPAELLAQETADQYPTRPISIIVPYPPGGFNDQVARLLAQDLNERWGQSVIVDNRPGGATVIGTEVVASAPGDGYTLGISPFAFAVNPGLIENIPYNTEMDFAHIAIFGSAYNLLAARPDFPANTVAELIDYARENPGDVDYASAGNGSSNHLSGEMFKSMAGIDIVHVPYPGSAPARLDVTGGHVDLVFDNLTNLQQLVEAGELKPLGVSIREESTLLPGVPPISQTLPDYEVTVWWGLLGPASMPEDIVEKINVAVNEFLAKPQTIEQFRLQGVVPIPGSPQDAEDYVRNQIDIWLPIAERAQMTAD